MFRSVWLRPAPAGTADAMTLEARLGQIPACYKNKNNAAARTAATAKAMSRSRGVRIGLPRRFIHVAFGVRTFTIGRVFIVSSYRAFRQRTPRITGFAGFFPQKSRRSANFCRAVGAADPALQKLSRMLQREIVPLR
jgi:hypothetical protein